MDNKELNKTTTDENKKVNSLSEFLAPEIEEAEEVVESLYLDSACYLF